MDGCASSIVRNAQGDGANDRAGVSRQAATPPASRPCCSRWIFHDACNRSLIEDTAGSEAWRVIVREQVVMQTLLRH